MDTPQGSMLLTLGDKTPRLSRGAWVAPGAVLVGDVELGEGASVWYGCVLRGDVNWIRVGPRTNIQDQCVIHVSRDGFPCELGTEVTVGHRAVVHGCKVGDGALIGIGAIILDGAEIGSEALIGAGAVVPPGVVIPEGMLAMGIPARVVRPLNKEERKKQRSRALAYVENARSHAESRRSLQSSHAD